MSQNLDKMQNKIARFVAKHGEAFRRQAHRLECHATHMKGYAPGGN